MTSLFDDPELPEYRQQRFIPVGKSIDSIAEAELRSAQFTIQSRQQLTDRQRQLIDACISYVCVNAKREQ